MIMIFYDNKGNEIFEFAPILDMKISFFRTKNRGVKKIEFKSKTKCEGNDDIHFLGFLDQEAELDEE